MSAGDTRDSKNSEYSPLPCFVQPSSAQHLRVTIFAQFLFGLTVC